MLLDISPLLRHRDFRLVFVGQLVSSFGGFITYVALPVQVYALTKSSAIVGLIGAAQLVPLAAAALWGGAVADALDRRTLLLRCETLMACGSLALVANSLLTNPSVLALFVIAAFLSAVNGFHRPALEAITQKLVNRDELAAVSALTSLRGTTAAIAGPSLAGLSIAAFGLPITYSIEVATFAVSVAALAAIRAMPPADTARPAGIATILEGLRYAGSRPELIGTYTVDIVAMTFAMPLAVFPALAEQLGGTPTVGFLLLRHEHRRFARHDLQCLDSQRAAPRRRSDRRSGTLGSRNRRARSCDLATDRIRLPRARGSRRQGERLVSDDDLERNDPAVLTRPHGEHRAALVHDGAVARQRARWLHGGAIRASALDRVGRHHLCGWRRAVRAGVAAILALSQIGCGRRRAQHRVTPQRRRRAPRTGDAL
jgi:hypothetical protein